MFTRMADREDPRAQTWDPDLYRDRASFVHRMASDLLELLAPRPGERVLDLGCGTGELTAQIARAGAKVVGVDSSPAMIQQARRAFPEATFQVGSGEALSFDREFDAVFSNAALHWMRRADATAQGIAGALRPGGRLVAEFGGKGCIATVCQALEEVLPRFGEDPKAWLPWYFPDVPTYVGVLAAAGLEARYAHLFDRPTPVEGDDGLAAWLRLFLSRLAEHLGAGWEDFARQVERRAAPVLFRDGRWVLDYVRLRVVAVKPS